MDSLHQPPTSLLNQLEKQFKKPANISRHTALQLLSEVIEAKEAEYLYLTDKKYRYLIPKSKETTELDRKTSLESATAESQAAYQKLLDYQELLLVLLRP